MDTAIMHPVPDHRLSVICNLFYIWALWRSASDCPDVKNCTWRLNLVWHRMHYSGTHMATVGVKGLIIQCSVTMDGSISHHFPDNSNLQAKNSVFVSEQNLQIGGWTVTEWSQWTSALRRAGLVVGWVTVYTISVSSQPSSSTQPSALCGTVKWVSAFGLSYI